MKKQPFTYRDAKRIGGTLLKLTIGRTWLEYARWYATGSVADSIFTALRTQHGERVTVEMTEKDAEDLAYACPAAER